MFGRKKNTVDMERIASSSLRTPLPQKKATTPRTTSRAASWAPCALISDHGFSQAGIVVDYSDTGARVRFRSHQSLPGHIRLKSSQLGIDRSANVVWQDRGDAGLRFE